MCPRKCVLKIGEKIFNILVILGLIGGLASAISSGLLVGGKDGLITGGLQLIISWSGTLIIALIVYSLLDIRRSLAKPDDECSQDKGHCSK